MKLDISKWALGNQKLLALVVAVLVFAGVFAYIRMPKLEDPEIVVRQAVVVGIFPGASASQVEMELTDPLEKAIRKINGIGFVQSYSYADMCFILVSLDAKVPEDELQPNWNIIRNHINATPLPAGAQVMVRDDFGDVSGMFYAVTGDGMSLKHLEEYAEMARRELQSIKGVGRIDIYGARTQCINISLKQDRISSLHISPAEVIYTLNGQNANVYSGYFVSGGHRIRVAVDDRYKTTDDIKDLILQGHEDDQIRLGDIATIEMADEKLSREEFYRDGQPALGISIAAQSGTDIIKIGKQVDKTLQQLSRDRFPAGVTFEKVFYQPERVGSALNTFVVNLIESVLLVVILLIFCMNMRSGIILGITLVITVLSTIFVLFQFDGTLQRVSLGSFILVMGMLVDNAIVIIDGILVDKAAGRPRQEALTAICRKTAMPLLGATAIAILAFLPIFLSPDVTGLYVRDMFIVLAVALIISWILALVIVPVIASRWIYRKDEAPATADDETTTTVTEAHADDNAELPSANESLTTDNATAEATETTKQYTGRWYQLLRRILDWALARRRETVLIMLGLLILAGIGYTAMPQGLFPDMEYDQLYMEYKLPEGASPAQVRADLEEIRQQLMEYDYITHVTTSIGGTPCRYNLVRSVALPSLSYGELIIDFKNSKILERHIHELQDRFAAEHPDAYLRFKRYNLMFMKYPIEIQFIGPNPEVLHHLADSAMAIVKSTGVLNPATTDWSPRVPYLAVDYDQSRARNKGITRSDIGLSLMSSTDGLPVSSYYDGRVMHNIYLNITDANNRPIDDVSNATVFGVLPNFNQLTGSEALSNAVSGSNPLASLYKTSRLNEVSNGIHVAWEDPVIPRYNGQRTQSILGAPAKGYGNEDARKILAREIERIHLPEGYKIVWGGEKMATDISMENLFANYPLAILLMIVILVWLFKDYRSPLLLFCSIPFIFVGVVPAMLLSGQNFGFVAIVGVLGLVGMMLKNGIVLVDEIRLQLATGKNGRHALIDSALSRLRPVAMASLTTVLGMVPLLFDDMFASLAATIMGGLTIGTIIVLIFIPVLYAIFYKIK
ncbi:MAG: efflux RND transporter permease subunit [Bacteroidales bacterium]|nr:efflux RND transporter permease subunit [Bacteroidales bacterium]